MLGFALGAWTNSLYVDLTGNFADFLPIFENEKYFLFGRKSHFAAA